MQEYGLALTGILPYMDIIYDSVLITGEEGSIKTKYSRIFYAVFNLHVLIQFNQIENKQIWGT